MNSGQAKATTNKNRAQKIIRVFFLSFFTHIRLHWGYAMERRIQALSHQVTQHEQGAAVTTAVTGM